jgi:drug/metabolite transporter (DMT)-like permease
MIQIPSPSDLFMLSSNHEGELLAVISAFCLAAAASIYKKGLEETDAMTGNLIRTGFTSLGFFLFMILKGTLRSSLQMLTSSILFWLVLSAFFGFFLGDFLYLNALKTSGVSRIVPLSSVFPLFIAVWSFLTYDTPLTIFLVVGTVFIILAINLISREQNSSDEHAPNQTRTTRGIGYALLAALCWSVSITILDHLLIVLPPEAVGGFRFLVAFLLSAAAGSLKPFTFSKNSLLWIGVGSMAVLVLSNYFFLEAIRIIGSARAAPISSAYPVISVFLAAALLKEKVTRKILGGAFLSFLGVLFVVLS